MHLKTDNQARERSRCGIILAAGEGKRLQPLVRRMRGDDLPKQYVNFLGGCSLLDHTLRRAERLCPPQRLFTVVGQRHLTYPEATRQLSRLPKTNVIVQPQNRDTGPGILLPLMHISKRYPESTVAIFPSDHCIGKEELFVRHVEAAFRIVDQEPSCFVLLGLEPSETEVEYGYIVPQRRENGGIPSAVGEISQFVEKPEASFARELATRGALWNSMIAVFRTNTLLEWASKITPCLYSHFDAIRRAIGTPSMKLTVEKLYRDIEPVNFSKDLLEPLSLRRPSPLLVLPVKGVYWSDWGSEHRIAGTLEKFGYIGALQERQGQTRKPNPKGLLRWSRDTKPTKKAVNAGQESEVTFEMKKNNRSGANHVG